MKLTPRKKEIVMEMVRKYAKNFSIKIPKVWMTTKEVLDAPLHITTGRRTSAWKSYGVCYRDANTIFINVRKNPNTAFLRDTIIHELAHLRFPYMGHGDTFDSMIKRCLSGEQFKEYKKR